MASFIWRGNSLSSLSGILTLSQPTPRIRDPLNLRPFIRPQGRNQPHSPGWARLPLSSFFPQVSIDFSYSSSNFFSFSSFFCPSGWVTRPPGKALATLLFDLRSTKVANYTTPSLHLWSSPDEDVCLHIEILR